MTSAPIPPVIPRRPAVGSRSRGTTGAVRILPWPPRHCIVIPATLRRRCGLLPGDPVLLAPRPAEDTLTAYSLAVVGQALAARRPRAWSIRSILAQLAVACHRAICADSREGSP